MLKHATMPSSLASRLPLQCMPMQGRVSGPHSAGSYLRQSLQPSCAMSFPRRAQHRLHAQRVSLSQPSGRLWMLAAGRSVQQQEAEAREELDNLEAEREAAMQSGMRPPS